jgi:hypothetical protein
MAATSSRPWGWTSLALLLVLLSATATARLTGHYPDSRPVAPHADPIQTSQTWLATQNYRLMAQFKGAHITNVTMVRRESVLRGDVQTMDAHERRQTGYYRFRVRTGAIGTTTTGPLVASRWATPTPSQQALLRDVTDPQRLLAPFLTGKVRDLGRSGDATVYGNERGDSLYLVGGRPLQVVTHTDDGEIRVWRFSPATGASRAN